MKCLFTYLRCTYCYPIQTKIKCQNDTFSYSSCCKGCGFKFSSFDELQVAIRSFEIDSIKANMTYGLMNCWDTSKISDMSFLFSHDANDATYNKINEPIQCWNVSKVTKMKGMFNGAMIFDQPLNTWDVSSVTDMSYMFSNATSFNQPLDRWLTREVTSTAAMFQGAERFNQHLDSWDVSSVQNMNRMFYHAKHFQKDLCSWYNLSFQQTPVVNVMFYDTSCSNESDPDFESKISFCANCLNQVSF